MQRVILEPFGNHIFTQPNDQYWTTFDWQAAALFWCSDLQSHFFRSRRDSGEWFIITTPSGTEIATAPTERAAWMLTLAKIFEHLVKIRKERDDGAS